MTQHGVRVCFQRGPLCSQGSCCSVPSLSAEESRIPPRDHESVFLTEVLTFALASLTSPTHGLHAARVEANSDCHLLCEVLLNFPVRFDAQRHAMNLS